MKFSIVVPIYNVEKYLNKCVESVLNQTFQDFEIILVDDGSPDNCPQMCDEWAKKDDRIRVIHKQNGGLLQARVSGMSVAKGDYIISVDSDDYIHEDLLKVCYLNLEDKPDCLVFNFVSDNPKSPDEKTFKHNYLEKHFYLDTEQKRFKYYLENVINTFNGGWETCRRCIKRELIDLEYLSQLPRINYAEDYLLTAILMPKLKKIKILDFEGYNYVLRKESITNSLKNNIIVEEINNLLYKIFEYYKKNSNLYFIKNFSHIHYTLMISSMFARISLPKAREVIDIELKNIIESYKVTQNKNFYNSNIKKYKKLKDYRKLHYNENRPYEYWQIKYSLLLLDYFKHKNFFIFKIKYKSCKFRIFLIVLKRRAIRLIKKVLS